MTVKIESGKNWNELTKNVCAKMGNRIGAEVMAYAMLKAKKSGLDPEVAVKFSFADIRALSSGRRGATDKSKRRPIRYTPELLDRIYEASIDTTAERKRQKEFFVPSPLTIEVERINRVNRAETKEQAEKAMTHRIDYTKQARKNYALIEAMHKSHIGAQAVIQGQVFLDGSNTLEVVDTFVELTDVIFDQKEAMRELLNGLTEKQLTSFRAGFALWRAGEWDKHNGGAIHKACGRIADRVMLKPAGLFEVYLRLAV